MRRGDRDVLEVLAGNFFADNALNFALHGAVIGLVFWALLLRLHRGRVIRRLTAFVAVVLLGWSGFALSHLRWAEGPYVVAEDAIFRVASINVLYSNPRSDLVVDWVRTAAPDLVMFQEVHGPWPRALRELDPQYPYRLASRDGGLMLSKVPLRPLEDLTGFGEAQRFVAAELRVGNRRVHVIGGHFAKPAGISRFEARNAGYEAVIRRVQDTNVPVIVAADFNATPLSPALLSFMRRSGLSTAQIGLPPRSSWPARLPYAGLLIDHVMVGKDWRILRMGAGEHVGSNHLPVYADLALSR